MNFTWVTKKMASKHRAKVRYNFISRLTILELSSVTVNGFSSNWTLCWACDYKTPSPISTVFYCVVVCDTRTIKYDTRISHEYKHKERYYWLGSARRIRQAIRFYFIKNPLHKLWKWFANDSTISQIMFF